MEKFQAIIQWIVNNYAACFAFLASIVVSAEIICRLTPTTKDDTVLEKIGKVLKGIMDFLKIPNNLKAPEVK